MHKAWKQQSPTANHVKKRVHISHFVNERDQATENVIFFQPNDFQDHCPMKNNVATKY